MSKIIKTYALIYPEDIIKETCKSEQPLILKTFNIKTPFYMNLQANKIATSMELQISSGNNRPTKKRKYNPKMKFQKFVNEMKCVLNAYEEMKNTNEFQSRFSFCPTAVDFRENNSDVISYRDSVMEITSNEIPILPMSQASPKSLIKEFYGHQYLIPKGSRYVCDDVRNIDQILNNELFDIVVMDPPWENKMVRRRKQQKGMQHSYDTMSVDEILSIPLPPVLSNNALVFIWITNNLSVIDQVVGSLHLWNLELVTNWYWLKLTKAGIPICSLEGNSNKLPFEQVLITCRNGPAPRLLLPKNLVFSSVPSTLHSYKPCLKDLLRQTLPNLDDYNCLELFARSLIPMWTSVGLEVLRFQHVDVL